MDDFLTLRHRLGDASLPPRRSERVKIGRGRVGNASRSLICPGCRCFLRVMTDLLLVALTVAVFALLGLAAKAVGRL
ncbi:hypothetical protein [Actinomadura opuntiae]|nr:hypothetical protein [Actinomadura sp. OS1-43]MDL4817573.1 hypothetical protein [Actinomadura sp. OS1-43]